jgi:hypothetical protein
MELRPFAFSPRQVAVLENCALTLVYERLRRGEYEAVRDGRRTKILLESIERRRANLPKAEFTPLHQRGRTIGKKETAAV